MIACATLVLVCLAAPSWPYQAVWGAAAVAGAVRDAAVVRPALRLSPARNHPDARRQQRQGTKTCQIPTQERQSDVILTC